MRQQVERLGLRNSLNRSGGIQWLERGPMVIPMAAIRELQLSSMSIRVEAFVRLSSVGWLLLAES